MSGDGDGKPIGPLGGLLHRWESQAPYSGSRQNHCGGALLFVSREEAQAMIQGGIRFAYDHELERLPEEGRDSVRVRCNDDVMVKDGVVYGLCARCSGYEAAIRKRLRDEKLKAEGIKPRGSRRDGV